MYGWKPKYDSEEKEIILSRSEEKTDDGKIIRERRVPVIIGLFFLFIWVFSATTLILRLIKYFLN